MPLILPLGASAAITQAYGTMPTSPEFLDSYGTIEFEFGLENTERMDEQSRIR